MRRRWVSSRDGARLPLCGATPRDRRGEEEARVAHGTRADARGEAKEEAARMEKGERERERGFDGPGNRMRFFVFVHHIGTKKKLEN